MTGETSLNKLLKSISPKLLDDEYVFCSIAKASYGDFRELEPLASFCEAEGLSLILPKIHADKHGLNYESVFRCITLAVHSSLDAIGLTAALTAKLAEHGISANVVAAYYHDHICVPAERFEQAMVAFSEFSR